MFLLGSSLSAEAQNSLSFHHLTRADGLLHDNATCVVQDSLGYIWIGTHRGINRFDGYTIDSYKYTVKQRNIVPVNRVYSMQVIGRFLWLATEGGLACFDTHTKRYTAYHVADKVRTDFFKHIKSIRRSTLKDHLWLIADKQIRLIHIRQGTAASGKRQPTVSSVRIGDSRGFLCTETNPKVAENGKGIVWFSGNRTVSIYRYKARKGIVYTGTVDRNDLSGLRDMVFQGGYLWAIYYDRIVRYKAYRNGVLHKEAERTFKTHGGLIALRLSTRHAWLAASDQLIRISRHDLKDVHIFTHSSSLPNTVVNDINSIYIDRNDNIWLSGWMSGVAYTYTHQELFHTLKYSPKQYSATTGSAEFISALCYDSSDGYVYIGRKFGGISRLDTKTKQVEWDYCVQPQLQNSITCLQTDRQHIYAGIGNNIVVIAKDTKKVTQILPTSNRGYIFWLCFDRFGRLWAATYAGLECMEKTDGKWTVKMTFTTKSPLPRRLSTNYLHNICYDREANELIITSTAGLNRVILDSRGNVQNIVNYVSDNSPGSLSNNFTWAISKGAKGVYWVGTMGSGLNKVTFLDSPDGKYTYRSEHFGIREGAESEDMEAIQVDRYGRIWCSGFNLSCFDEQTKRFKTFNVSDGLQGPTFATSSSACDAQGTLYFGGSNGMNYFLPASENSMPASMHVYFTHLVVNGTVLNTDIEYTRNVTLPYPETNFTVAFTTLDYNSVRHTRFRYKMEGYDEWHEIQAGEKPSITYQNLPYGSHTLVVEAGDWADWSGEVYTLQVYVTPPLWRTWWAYVIYVLTAGFLIYTGTRYFIKWTQMKNFIAMRKQKERHREEMMQMKTRFFMDISHEFRTPLTLISHAVHELKEEDRSGQNRYVDAILRNSRLLSNMINELLDLHRADMKSLRLHATKTNITEYMSAFCSEFSLWAESVGVNLQLTVHTPNLQVWIDQEQISKILRNIVSNSLRYTPKGGSIDISIEEGEHNSILPLHKDFYEYTAAMEKGKQIIIRIADTGTGIPRKELPKVFDRLHQVESNSQQNIGTGIGLALVKSLVTRHHGGIVISSSLGLGTETILFLPLSTHYLKDEEKEKSTDFSLREMFDSSSTGCQPADDGTMEEETQDGSKPSLLLVEDNGEVLMMMQEYFKKEYNTILAKDGREALAKCKAANPDLIISDVMMPNMDGMELCAKLKNAIATCHIPIILLTAVTQEEKQIEGLELGADAYIPKPYNPRVLKVMVRNLIVKSRLIRTSMQLNENIREKIEDEKDRQFFDRFNQIIQANLADNDFSIQQVISELGTNRTSLYNFIKTSTGMSLGKYIMKLRLDKAAQLLISSDMSVSEASLEVGIDSLSYFTRSFKQQFGVTPTEFMRTKR